MNETRELLMRALNAIGLAETTIKGIRVGQDYYDAIVMARKDLAAADAALKKLGRKPDSACGFQGCYAPAYAVHRSEFNPVNVRLCETHSATSRLKLVAVIGGAK